MIRSFRLRCRPKYAHDKAAEHQQTHKFVCLYLPGYTRYRGLEVLKSPASQIQDLILLQESRQVIWCHVPNDRKNLLPSKPSASQFLLHERGSAGVTAGKKDDPG